MLLIDIKAVNGDTHKIIDIGWTIFPLFSIRNDKIYVRTGNYIVSISIGSINRG